MSSAHAILKRARAEERAAERLAPKNRDGYLYYVRLKTDLGAFYKLGYTKSSNLEDRFSFNNSKDYELIDKVFIHVYLPDAYDIETRLHRYFSSNKAFGSFSASPDLPLYKSGQGEIYYDDVLKLDPGFSSIRRWATFFRVMEKDFSKTLKIRMLSWIALAVGSLLIVLFACLVLMPFSYLIEKIDNSDPKWKRSKKNRVEGENTHQVEIENLIEWIKETQSSQKDFKSSA